MSSYVTNDENIDDEYDIKTIMEYEKDKKKGIELKPIENLFKEIRGENGA